MDEHLRISDAEREQAATALGEHFAQGRLTVDEHAERLDRIWAARTRGELVPVFRDLPDSRADSARPAAPRRTPARFGPPGPPPGPRALLLPILLVLVLLTVLTHVPWVLLFVGVLVFVGIRRRGRSGAC